MNSHEDWFMRQIEGITQVVAQLVFHKDIIQYDIPNEAYLSQTDLIHKNLLSLLAEKKICEAEDYLFETYKEDDPAYLKLAVDFYQRLNGLSDETLNTNNFSREEIKQGLDNLLKIANINLSDLDLSQFDLSIIPPSSDESIPKP